MVDVIQALKYPFSNKKDFIIAAVVNFFWFLLVPVFFINGYLVRIVRSTIQGQETMPSWDNILEILKHGFFVTMIILAYMLIPILLAYGSFAMTGELPVPGSPEELGVLPEISPVAFALSILSFIVFLAVIFILPMVVMVYSASEDLKTAYDLPLIFDKIRYRLHSYLVAYGLTVIIYIIFLILTTAIFLIPVIGGVLSGLVMIYPAIFSIHLFAQAFRETL